MIERCLELEILHPDDRRETLILAAPRVLVGSAIHCDVRVGDVWSPAEEVLLEAIGDEIVAHARSQDSLPLVDGRPFVHLNVAPDTVITAGGGARIRVRTVPAKEPASARLSRMVTSGILLSVLVTAPVLGYLALSKPPRGSIAPAPASVSLWDGTATECRAATADQADALGGKLRGTGERQRERAPFAVLEGALAVRSFDGAAKCFARAGRAADAERMEIAAAALKAQIEEGYRIHRLRLEHAIETRDEPAVVHELEVLEALTTGKSGPYVDWLRSVERTLTPRSPRDPVASTERD
jgi:hypothetical protein